MFGLFFKKFFLIITFSFVFFNSAQSQIIKKIEINGNKRLSNETILMFIPDIKDKEFYEESLNEVLKSLYDSNYFKNVTVKFENNVFLITVDENPIIQNIEFNGIKAKKIKQTITENLTFRSRSSFNPNIVKNDKKKILSNLKQLGYYFATVDVSIEELKDNKINLIYDIVLGNKSKIKRISLIGDKIYKDKKLKSIIVSEEYKFWKFISGKKYLNSNLIKLDERLLKNFYINNGYYNVNINSSFAKLINNDEFELIFNIDANEKIYFGNLILNIPKDFNSENFKKVDNYFEKIKDKPYSLQKIEKILELIETISVQEQYMSIKARTAQKIIGNKINYEFIIEESEKYLVEKINIYGNNVTRENVIRNQLEVDEGDIFNEILASKTLNNLKTLNFFEKVNQEIVDGSTLNSKIININVKEKATGEITAGAGIGTSGSTIAFGVRENNYLGKGIGVNSNLTVSEETIKGLLSINNPNFMNSDKSINFSLQALETDRLKESGYETNKAGFSLGTRFEYLDDLRLGLTTSNYYEKITTNSLASARQKKQQGHYWDSFLNLNFDYDKRNQKFQTNQGFRSRYGVNVPILSNTNTLTNSYSYKYFSELFEDNVSTVGVTLKSAFSINDKDVKLSERLFIPGSLLRGFESGKVGPKDNDDYIGGNYMATFNLTSTLPQIFPNSQNTDFLFFMDVANIWGVDYDSSLDDSDKFRSSVGFGVDWFTAIGPLNFSFAQPISKNSTDKEETFRFNLGTTF